MIREATKEDLEEISKILLEVHSLHQTNRPDIYKEFKEPVNMDYYQELIDHSDSIIFVKVENGLLVGYIALKLFEIKNHPVLIDKKIVKMEDLAVLKKYHKKGFGSLLFDKAVEYAKEISANKIELQVWDFNKSAKEFYLNKGMKTKFQNLELTI